VLTQVCRQSVSAWITDAARRALQIARINVDCEYVDPDAIAQGELGDWNNVRVSFFSCAGVVRFDGRGARWPLSAETRFVQYDNATASSEWRARSIYDD
jgi:hypothetical protein